MEDHRAVALNTLFQQIFFCVCVKLSLKNGVIQELLSYWKEVINAGTFTLSGFRKSATEDIAVEISSF